MSDAKKVHAWLADLDSHEIYNAVGCAEDFRAATGREPCWPTHSVARTKADIEARGFGGEVSGQDHDLVAYGWEIAEALADALLPGQCPYGMYSGRRKRFDVVLRALKEADL